MEKKKTYTEFFSWGDDTFGQLGLAQEDHESDGDTLDQENFYATNNRKKYLCTPQSLSFEVVIL